MCKAFITGLLAFILSAALPALEVKPVKPEAIAKCGETIEFIIQNDQSGPITYTFFPDGGMTLLPATRLELVANETQIIRTKMDRPGFILLVVSDGKKEVLSGVAVEPEKIQPGHESPEDFPAFWKEAQQKYAASKPVVELIPSTKYSNASVDVYRYIQTGLNGEKISGFLTIPRRPGKYPAIVFVPGAGPGYSYPYPFLADAISLLLNVHKYETSEDAAEQNRRYTEYNQAHLPLYACGDLDSRESYFFYPVILGIDYAIDYVAKMDKFDGKHLIADGSSQGGAIALIVAGLNPNITAVSANVPALCDHQGYLVGRRTGWPQLIGFHPGKKAEIESILPYFDAVNFARNIHVPLLISTGFIDRTCPPSSVYSAYNVCPSGDKQMVDMPKRGHEIPPEYNQIQKEFWKREMTK